MDTEQVEGENDEPVDGEDSMPRIQNSRPLQLNHLEIDGNSSPRRDRGRGTQIPKEGYKLHGVVSFEERIVFHPAGVERGVDRLRVLLGDRRLLKVRSILPCGIGQNSGRLLIRG